MLLGALIALFFFIPKVISDSVDQVTADQFLLFILFQGNGETMPQRVGVRQPHGGAGRSACAGRRLRRADRPDLIVSKKSNAESAESESTPTASARTCR